MLPDHLHNLFKFFFVHHLSTAQNDGSRIFDLIDEEFSEILHVDLAFGGIDHNNGRTGFNSRPLTGVDDCLLYIGKLADTRRLDKYTLGSVFLDNLSKTGLKISHKGAAATAGIHFFDLDAGLL
jgi:hypothetical protein